MLRFNQFNLTILLALMAIVCGLMAWSENWLIGFVACGCLVLLISAEVLTRNLPSPIVKAMNSNCQRHDGSISPKRTNVEQRVLRKLRRDFLWLLACVMAPSLFLVWFVGSQVVPLSIGASALTSMSSSRSEWKAKLSDEAIEFDRWKEKAQLFGDGETHKRFLWRYWPLIVIAGIAWFATSFVILKTGYIRLLRQASHLADKRGGHYVLRDLAKRDFGNQNTEPEEHVLNQTVSQ
jgi:hypothetical protein